MHIKLCTGLVQPLETEEVKYGRLKNIPCLTETYLVFDAATKLACGRESSREKSSSFVTTLDRVLRTALDPMGAK